jgi:hypothetical protein
MAQSDFRDYNDIEVIMAFDQNGHVRWVEFRDGTRHNVPLPQDEGPPPPGTFRSGPIKNINLLKTEVFEILVWEELDDKGNVVKQVTGTHINCRPYP